MRAFWWLLVLLAWSVPSSALTKTQREKLCSKTRHGCLWINPFFNASRGFPIHSTVDFDNYLEIYCYDGPEPLSLNGLTRIWSGLQIEVKCKQDVKNIQIFFSNKSAEIDQSEDKLTYRDASNRTFYHLAKPYDVFCVGVLYNGRDFVNYDFYAKLELMWRFPALLAVGVFLLFNAKAMSRSVTFHYSTGVTFGVVASMLILLYYFSKVIPKKSWLGLGVLAGGYTLVGSFFYWLYRHSLDLLASMWQYIIIYVLISAVISFAIIYRLGPVENPRTFNLIQWSIQLLALILIGLASQLPEAGLVFVAMAMLTYLIPARCNPIVMLIRPITNVLCCLLSPFTQCFSFLFKQRYKFKFLTMEEYDEQGRSETRKALDELRDYCSRADMWRTLGKLKDAGRFSRFLSGDDHVTAQEQVDHEWTFIASSTDVESDEEEGGGGMDDTRDSSRFCHSLSSHDTSTHSASFLYTSDDSPRPLSSPTRAPLHSRRTANV